jgi:predicted ATP-grasp superfamily ATP-dependent carboligase
VGWFESKVIMERGSRHYKALIADNSERFYHLYWEIKKTTDDFVIQEYVPGGDHHIYSFHAYFNRRSEPLGYYTGRKIRTYPSNSGESSYIELVKDSELARIGIDILKRLDFVGFAKLDFKRDPHKNRFSLLEINPRFTLWNYLGAVCGVNLPVLAYRDLLEETCELQTSHMTNVRWLSFDNDVQAFWKCYRREGTLSFLQWFSSYRGNKIYNIFSWQDPYPLIISCWHRFRTIIRAVKKRLIRKLIG